MEDLRNGLLSREFVREEHVYKNDAFGEFLLDAVRFFNGTPVVPLPPPNTFTGAGVYAIYCIARKGIYQRFGNTVNRTAYNVPIYVGKGRAAGKISQWDVLHPGRSWVKNLIGEKPEIKDIMRRVTDYMVGVR